MATLLEAVKRIRNQVIKINKREDRDIKFLGFLKIRRIFCEYLYWQRHLYSHPTQTSTTVPMSYYGQNTINRS